MFLYAFPVVLGTFKKDIKTRFGSDCTWDVVKHPARRLVLETCVSRCVWVVSCVRRPTTPADSLRGRFLPTAFDMENSALLPSEVGLSEEENVEALAEREKQGIISPPFGREGLKPPSRIFWNRHSQAAKLRWENDENFRRRKRLWLKSGAETRKLRQASKIKPEPQRKRDYIFSEEGRARKREKLQKRHRNFVEWMQERLDSGEELRRRIYDDEYKKILQKERSRIARERHRKRLEKLSKSDEEME
ncbi:hypothetical protein Gasu2_68650 [Galdieria sulphuraria]|uniref:Uncharacterized protein n=1 Tax=Galdieria sulphuraria TaxID=130081 RepID=M2W1Q8_GALSU|nr:hypothetical protein Gasu_30480 isoform 2 [Galdieria sulphuraria]XP_005706131.1 hypothetical protein Gasu_30480 isoform 1 [Galdieria sulphuraria]EME29610.1 hypothetical protein isoform 2 [Galdieria sulphuraria]EME29611.1 hypothetical protein isoform 1 [Galdieria sulphuraria]GJD12794.1 hypothetical protein Gasu2_68650 [Galdieria sulphuraria]|eukprot:XP_005706130.1 hypothetical protein isoform 2 [Galdieria sulphuraria]